MNLNSTIEYVPLEDNESDIWEHRRLPSYANKTGRDLPEDREYLSERIACGSVPLMWMSVGGKVYKFRKPLKLEVVKDNDRWLVENQALSIYGSGVTINEAIDELKSDIVFLYKHYSNLSHGKLIGRGVELKRIYETLFEEVE